MRKSIILIAAIAAFGSCTSNKNKAESLLSEARQLTEGGSYNTAKIRLDSIKSTYPKEFDVLKQGVQLMRQIQIRENERNAAFADSLMVIRKEQAAELQKNFVFLKQEGYEEIGSFVFKGMTVEKNIERNYIRCGVDEYGEMYLASVYYGAGKINHSYMKAELKDGTYAETLNVAYDGGNNYRFSDNGKISEIVTYKKQNINGMIDFINLYKDQDIKITLLGDKKYVFYLDKLCKNAIANTVELSAALSDVLRLGQESDIARNKATDLQRRIDNKARELSKK